MNIDYEQKKKRDEYEFKLAKQVENFAKRINAGSATSEEITFMLKVADILDEARNKKLRELCWDVHRSSSKIIDSV